MKPSFKNIFFRREKSHAFHYTTTSIVSGFLLFSYTPVTWALPSGGSVVAGDAVISQGGNTMTIDQLTNKAIIDWQRFGINANEALRFMQPDKASVILNRVTGAEASKIFGNLTANGNVFIINPNGILFGANSTVDVAGLMASTLNIKNEDFMAGNYTFTQNEAAKLSYVVNEGKITIGDNGFAYLVAPGVENKGIIIAKAGHVAMASGKEAYVDFSGDGLVKFKVSGKITEKIIGPDGKPMKSAVSNSGNIQAQGGQVLLSGDTARDVVTSVVNNSGIIEASSFDDLTGSVRMEARTSGDVVNSGKISVSSKTKGKKAGSVVLSGENVGQFGTITADGQDGNGGSIDLRASKVVALSNDSITTANANGRGNGGTILVIGEDSARVGTGAVLQARGGVLGGNGGFIETSGHKSLEIGSIVDVSAAAGKAGTWLIDPADLEIVGGSTETNIDKNSGAFTSNNNGAKLGVNLILNALNLGNVVIKTGEGGTQEGNITVNADIVYNGLLDKTLTLDAHNNIIINRNISASGSAGLGLTLKAGGNVSIAGGVTIFTNGANFSSQSSSFFMAAGAAISTNGGNFSSRGNFSMAKGTTISTDGGNLSNEGGNFSMVGGAGVGEESNISTDGGSFSSEGGNFSIAGGSILTNGGSFSSEGGSFSMAAGSSIDTGSGAIVIRNTGSISLRDLTASGITVTQAGGILVEGTVTANGIVELVANTGSITTSGNGIIVADTLNLVTKGTENASIGTVTTGVGGGGSTTITTTGLKVNVKTVNASTQSGISNGASTGNIIIDNDGDLTLGTITTNGDKGDSDIATVIINSKNGSLTSGAGTRVDAFSGSFTAKNDITLNTALSVLKVETLGSGNITIDNTSDSLFILGAIAREYGNTAMLSNGDVKAMTAGEVVDGNYVPGGYVDGTKNVSITSTGEIGLQGTISATNNVSLESKNGSIINATDGSSLSTITSNRLSLKAAGAVGALGSALKTLTGNRIDVSAGTVWAMVAGVNKEIGGVYLEEVNRLNIGTITATGSQGNVSLTATTGNAYFAHADSKITAKDGSVKIHAIAGDVLTYEANTADVIEANAVNLEGKAIGTVLRSINTNTGSLNLVSTDGDRGLINVKNSSALSSITVVTPGAPVNIISTGATLKFGKDEKLSITSGTGTALDFSNNLGGIKFDNIDVGTNDLTLKAAKAISQSSGKLIAGNATITAGENIGTSSSSIQTQVSSLNLTSGKNGIYVSQESSGTLKLNAVASGESSDIKIVQTGTGDMEIKKVTSAKGGVILQSSGSILNGNSALSDINIKGNSLYLTANGSIGTDAKGIFTNVSKSGGNADFSANATNGGIFMENSGSIKLDASTSNTGDIDFSNAGNIALGVLNAGADHDLVFNVKGALTDVNGDALNITARNSNLRASSIATSADKLDILVKQLDVMATSGALYIKQLGNGDFYLDNASSTGTASIEAGGTIYLGTINSPAQSVILKSETGDILDNRPAGSKQANVNAKSLDISARNLGTEGKRLSLNVGILSSSSSGNMFAENLGSLHVTADSLTGKGVGQKVSIIASDITVFDNSGGITTLDHNGSLELIAKNGNIIFLNTNDTIAVGGTGSIYFEAMGTSRPDGETGLVGLIVAGNLTTAGGDITLRASSHISINLLNAGKGNVTVQSSNGLIIDNNGDKVNIIGKNVVLSGKTLSQTQLDDDKKMAIADVGDKNLNKQLQEQLWNYAKNDVATYEGLVAVFNKLYSEALSKVESTEGELDAAQTKADALYQTFMALNAALDAANLVASILEIPAGAAQAIPLVGDGGSGLALGIANSVLSGMGLALGQAERAMDSAADKANDLTIALGDLKNELHSNKQDMETNETLLNSKNVELADLTERVDKATISLAASKIIEALTQQAAKNNNVIGTSSQALGVQAERVDATAFGQSNVYLESPTSLGVGDITAHGKDTVVEVTAKNDIFLQGTTTSEKNIILYSKDGAITAGADSKLVSGDLVAVAKKGIGVNGAAVNTQVDRIAAITEEGGAHFVNANGSEALSIDEITVTSSNLNKTVTGVTAKDDVSIETSDDLVLNKAVRNTSKAGTVTLTATDGSITGTADNPPASHVEGGTLVATAADGIGSGTVALRTDISKLTGSVTGEGLVNIVEKDAIELTSVTSADGSITIQAGGNIDAKNVVSLTDADGNTIELDSSNGNIVAGTINAGATHGDIILRALAGQVNNDGNTSTRIAGHYLTIDAKSGIGSVGTNANTSLDTSVVRLNATTKTGAINISESDDLDVKNVKTGDGDITIASVVGDLNITKIAANGTGNTVTLEAAGKIADATPTGDENGAVITATNLAATAQKGIGSESNSIEVNVENLESKTTTGGIYINDLDGDLHIGGVTPNLGKPALNGIEAGAGDIVIRTAGAMQVGESVTATDGDISLSAEEGDLTTNAAVTATTGNVDMTAGKGIGINGTVNAAQNVTMTAEGGDIVTTKSVTAGNDVTMDAFANITIGDAVTAGNNVAMTAGNGIAINGAVTGGQDVTMTAEDGDITTTAAVAATLGDVTMTASDNVTLGDTVTANKNVSVTATEGDITTNAAVAATTGNVDMTAGKGIGINGTVNAAQNVTMTAEGGDITTTKAVTAGNNVAMTAGNGIAINGAVTGGQDVTMTAEDGDITTTAAVAATLGDVTMDASANITIGDTVTAANDIDMTAGNGIEINSTVTAKDGDISMLAFGDDINLNQTVSAAKGDVTLEATKGAIFGTANNPPVYHVVAKTLKATAAKGIGGGLAALRTNIEKFVGLVTGKGNVVINQTGDLDADITTEDGAITVNASGTIDATNIVSKTDSDSNDISLTSKDGDILVGNIQAGQGKEADVILNAENGKLQANRPTGKPIVADELIAVAKSGIDLDTTVNSADLVVTDDGDIKIKETNDIVLKNVQTQGDGSISVTAGGKLDGVNVVANNGAINLNAKDDLIAGHVVSTTNAIGNDIELVSNEGDIIVDYVAAGTGSGGDVTLKAEAGEIRESTPKDSEVDIVGNKVNLHAKGDIGVGEGGGLDIDSEILNAYSSEGNISLADVGDIVIHELHAKKGTVKVTSGGFISDDNNNDTKIIAKDIILEAVSGIGVVGDASTRALDTEVGTLTASVSGNGGINIDQRGNIDIKKATTANGDITLVANGNIGVDLITAKGTGNTVDLKAIAGAITDINDTANEKKLNISADKVKLDGSHGVGTRGNPLEISTSEISAKGGTGGLYITNQREGMIINGYTTDKGDIVLTTAGRLVINDPVTNLGGGDISFTITDTGSDHDDIIVNAGISAVGEGSIYLNADDFVYQNANMTVQNQGNVHVTAGDSIYMANGTSTIGHLGNIGYKAGSEIELGKLIVTKHPHKGSVTLDAPIIRNNNALGDPAIEAGYIIVNTDERETKDLIFDLLAEKDNSYGIWLNKRLVGGLVSRDATFISEPRLEAEFREFGHKLFQMKNTYEILPIEPINYKRKGFTYDAGSNTWVFKP